MAWIIGKVTLDEMSEIKSRGWVPEDPPAEMLKGAELGPGEFLAAFFVDFDVLDLMPALARGEHVKKQDNSYGKLGALDVDKLCKR